MLSGDDLHPPETTSSMLRQPPPCFGRRPPPTRRPHGHGSRTNDDQNDHKI
jgi:hypothetical protein